MLQNELWRQQPLLLTDDLTEDRMSENVMSREKWVGLFRAIGLDDELMAKWHREFETRYPNGHHAFLEWLGVPQDEIEAIRATK